MKSIVLYLRKSRISDGETREEVLTRHLNMLTAHLNALNLNSTAIYKEIASAEKLEGRPRMQKLLKDIEEGLVDAVAVVALDRLTRGSALDQSTIIEVFSKAQIKIITLDRVYDFANKFDIELVEDGLFASRKEFETIKKRLNRGKNQAAADGYFVTSCLPFGYTKELDLETKKSFILKTVEEEAQIVRMIFDKLTIENLTLADIAEFLNSKGILNKNGGVWSTTTLRALVTNVVYIAQIKYKNKIYKGKHLAIIDKATFAAAQERAYITKAPVVSSLKLANPFAGLIKCSVCGAKMQKSGNRLKCQTSGCATVSAAFNKVEEEIIKQLKEELKNFSGDFENYNETTQLKIKSAQNNLEEACILKSKKTKALQDSAVYLQDGVFDVLTYKDRVIALSSELNAIESNISALERELERLSTNLTKAPCLDFMKVFDNYKNLSVTDKNKLLHVIVKEILYKKTKNDTENFVDFCLKITLQI